MSKVESENLQSSECSVSMTPESKSSILKIPNLDLKMNRGMDSRSVVEEQSEENDNISF